MSKKRMNTKFIGIVCVILASVCYGLVPSLSFVSFDLGVATETLLFNKFLYGAIMIWGYIFVRKIKFRFPRRAAIAMLITCAGYIATSTLFYWAFNYISGSLTTIISFTFPAIIVSFEMITGLEPVKKRKIAAVVLSLLGLILIVWSPGLRVNLIGVAIAFGSAITYSIYVFGLSYESIKQENNFAVAGYVIISAAIFNFIRCLLSDEPMFATAPLQIGMMLLLSVVCVFFAIVLYSLGVRMIGPGNAALINTLEPVLACVFGYLIVNDAFTPIMMLGAGLVVFAVLLTNLPERQKSQDGLHH